MNFDEYSEIQLYYADQINQIIRSIAKHHPAQAKIKSYHDESLASDGFVDNKQIYLFALQSIKTDADIAAELEFDQLCRDLGMAIDEHTK